MKQHGVKLKTEVQQTRWAFPMGSPGVGQAPALYPSPGLQDWKLPLLVACAGFSLEARNLQLGIFREIS